MTNLPPWNNHQTQPPSTYWILTIVGMALMPMCGHLLLTFNHFLLTWVLQDNSTYFFFIVLLDSVSVIAVSLTIKIGLWKLNKNIALPHKPTTKQFTKAIYWMTVLLFVSVTPTIYTEIQGGLALIEIPEIIKRHSAYTFALYSGARGVFGVLLAAVLVTLPLGYLTRLNPIRSGLLVSALPAFFLVGLNFFDDEKTSFLIQSIVLVEVISLPIIFCLMTRLGSKLQN